MKKGASHTLLSIAAIAGLTGAGLLGRGCVANRRLVEVRSTGPLTPNGFTQPGPSQGYKWVTDADLPNPGSMWKPVDIDSLSEAERARVPSRWW
jgi:hypothetical protein